MNSSLFTYCPILQTFPSKIRIKDFERKKNINYGKALLLSEWESIIHKTIANRIKSS